MQTRSMTRRAGVPHDIEAFKSYAEDIIGYVNKHNMKTRSKSKSDNVAMEFDNFNDVTYFDGWLTPENLPFYRKKIKTKTDWQEHISAICHHLTDADTITSDDLTIAEYRECHALMHGK
jgi:hypothetical protein